MPYTPAYNALFAKPLLNQLIAIIQRDQAAALAIVNASLAPITEFHKGPGARTAFPWLLLTANSTQFETQAVGTRHSTARVALALDVGQFDQEMAQDNARLRAPARHDYYQRRSATQFCGLLDAAPDHARDGPGRHDFAGRAGIGAGRFRGVS